SPDPPAATGRGPPGGPPSFAPSPGHGGEARPPRAPHRAAPAPLGRRASTRRPAPTWPRGTVGPASATPPRSRRPPVAEEQRHLDEVRVGPVPSGEVGERPRDAQCPVGPAGGELARPQAGVERADGAAGQREPRA